MRNEFRTTGAKRAASWGVKRGVEVMLLMMFVSGVCNGAAPASSEPSVTRVSRPAVNTGSGFFVLNGKLYDANGYEFHIRGVNRLHWDSDSAAGIAKSKANTVRWDLDFTRPADQNVSLVRSQSIQKREVPIVGNWAGTCSSDPNKLAAIVSTWVEQAQQWRKLDRYFILNIANEWGPSDSIVWRDAYIGAIGRLRTAGYRGAILIDSGGCGQDMQDLAKYSQSVFESDPQKNVIFAVHLYGGTNDYSAPIRAVQKGDPTIVTLDRSSPAHPFASNFNGSNNSYSGISAYQISGIRGMLQLNGSQPARQNVGGSPGAWTVTLLVDSTRWANYAGGGSLVDYNGNYAVRMARLADLSKDTGAAYIVGEFGPGRNIGPSPTSVTPAQIITAADANGVGWIAWAWDDNDLPGCKSDNNWFSMTYSCGTYDRPSDLTIFGQEVVLNPSYGIAPLGRPATIF